MTLKGYASPTLLATYEIERIPVIAEMLKITTELFNRVISSTVQQELDLQKAMQDASAQQLESEERSPWKRSRKFFQLYLNYRWSPAVIDERFADAEGVHDAYGVAEQDVRAGDRAPDAPELKVVHPSGSGQTTRLFDIFKPMLHTVLLFGSEDVQTFRSSLDVIRVLPKELFKVVLVLAPGGEAKGELGAIDLVVEDIKDYARDNFGLKDMVVPVVVLARPDGMVGAIATSEYGVDKYVSAVFARA